MPHETRTKRRKESVMNVTTLHVMGDEHNVHVHKWFVAADGGYYFTVTGNHTYTSGRYDDWHDALAEAIDPVENEFEFEA
jgi:hypothetical protein